MVGAARRGTSMTHERVSRPLSAQVARAAPGYGGGTREPWRSASRAATASARGHASQFARTVRLGCDDASRLSCNGNVCEVCHDNVRSACAAVAHVASRADRSHQLSGYDGGCARCASLGRDNLKWQLLASSAARQGWVSQSKCLTRARTAPVWKPLKMTQKCSKSLEIARNRQISRKPA